MNIAEWSIKRSTITWVLTFVFLVVGAISFNGLSRLEDPAFTIKQVVVLTPYPGATPAEVEEEVSNVIEKAVQELGEVDWIESQSTRGFSMIKININTTVPKEAIPQVFDELRRKVNDYQSQLPPGAGPSIVNDDFGDTYGLYLAITGEGYTDMELYEYAKFLQRELLGVQDVKRIILYGNQPEVIYVEMRREKMSELGISQQDIYNALASKNLPSPSGYITLGNEYIPVHPTGEFQSEKQFGDLLISSKGPTSESLVFLKDVADIKRGYQEPVTAMLRYDGSPAVGLAISTIPGGNVVEMGDALGVKLIVDGVIKDPISVEGVNIDVSLNTADLNETFMLATGQSLYQYLPKSDEALLLAFTANLADVARGYELSAMKLKLADTDVAGDLSYVNQAGRSLVTAKLHSDKVNLNRFVAKLTGEADPPINKERPENNKNAAIELPDTELPFELLKSLDAVIEYSIGQFQFSQFEPKAIKLNATRCRSVADKTI